MHASGGCSRAYRKSIAVVARMTRLMLKGFIFMDVCGGVGGEGGPILRGKKKDKSNYAFACVEGKMTHTPAHNPQATRHKAQGTILWVK